MLEKYSTTDTATGKSIKSIKSIKPTKPHPIRTSRRPKANSGPTSQMDRLQGQGKTE